MKNIKVHNAIEILTSYVNQFPQTDRRVAEVLNILTELYLGEHK